MSLLFKKMNLSNNWMQDSYTQRNESTRAMCNKLDNPEETDKFLDMYTLVRLSYFWENSLNRNIIQPSKEKDLLSFVVTWADPQGAVLSEITWTEKDKYRIWYHLYISYDAVSQSYLKNAGKQETQTMFQAPLKIWSWQDSCGWAVY